ncbi:hypothetical protein D5S18_22905 [Nocardia panacis]|uniref:DUF2637 domain-containing protein n=1 Tax=Nocardia panacis TaxID=2340916 RepID=A0A3A4KFC8_9NOCA|nr:hypothetical protein D5S18_22905 [Nocardia panacis]
MVLGMIWAGVNVQHNLVPSGNLADPLYWLSYGIEAMISIPIITIMVAATTAARWGRELDRGKVVLFEAALLGTTIALNAGPHLAAGELGRAAEYAIAPTMVGVVIWLHAWVSARYALLIDGASLPESPVGHHLSDTDPRPHHIATERGAPIPHTETPDDPRGLPAAETHPQFPIPQVELAPYLPETPLHNFTHWPSARIDHTETLLYHAQSTTHPEPPHAAPQMASGAHHSHAAAPTTDDSTVLHFGGQHPALTVDPLPAKHTADQGKSHRPASAFTAANMPRADQAANRAAHLERTEPHIPDAPRPEHPTVQGLPGPSESQTPGSTDAESTSKSAFDAANQVVRIAERFADRDAAAALPQRMRAVTASERMAHNGSDGSAAVPERTSAAAVDRKTPARPVAASNAKDGALEANTVDKTTNRPSPAPGENAAGSTENRTIPRPDVTRPNSTPGTPDTPDAGHTTGIGNLAPASNSDRPGSATAGWAIPRDEQSSDATAEAAEASAAGSRTPAPNTDHPIGAPNRGGRRSEVAPEAAEPVADSRATARKKRSARSSTSAAEPSEPAIGAGTDSDSGQLDLLAADAPARTEKRRRTRRTAAAEPATAQAPKPAPAPIAPSEPPNAAEVIRAAVESISPEELAADAAMIEAESDDAGIWAVARTIVARRLSDTPVEQLAEILTLADQCWTPTSIAAEVGLQRSAIAQILECARKVRRPYAISG